MHHVAPTQVQLTVAVAERAKLSKANAKRALGALDEIVMEELGNAQKVRIRGAGSAHRFASSPPAKPGWAGTRRPANRSRSPPSPRASTFVRAR
jgi:hypothetical protein